MKKLSETKPLKIYRCLVLFQIMCVYSSVGCSDVFLIEFLQIKSSTSSVARYSAVLNCSQVGSCDL